MAGRVDQRANVEAGAAADEEHRHQEAVADRLDLAPELGVCEVLLGSTNRSSAPATNAPRIVSMPSPPASPTKRASSSTAARTPSCAEVSSSALRVDETRSERPASIMPRPITTTSTAKPTSRKIFEPEPRRARRARREEERDEQDRAELGERRRGEHRLAELGLALTGVADDRDDEAERGRRQHDRDEQRVADRLERLEAERDDDRQPERRDEGDRDGPDAAAQAGGVDLEAREEQEEREPEQREHHDGEVDLEPPEPRGPDDHADHDLQRHGRHPDLGRQVHEDRARAAPRRRRRGSS